jgi:hypothetical protein
MKKLLATITAVGVLTLGAAGTAFAADNGGGGASDQPAASTQTQNPQAQRGARRVAFKVAVEAATTTIGVDAAELKAAVKGGQTVGAFAESKGVSAGSVVDAIVKALDDRIDQAVADGKLPAERAAKVKERVPQLADRFVNTLPKRVQAAGQASPQG